MSAADDLLADAKRFGWGPVYGTHATPVADLARAVLAVLDPAQEGKLVDRLEKVSRTCDPDEVDEVVAAVRAVMAEAAAGGRAVTAPVPAGGTEVK